MWHGGGFFLLAGLTLLAHAQPQSPPAERARDFEARIDVVEKDPSLAEAFKNRAIGYYTEAVGLLRELEQSSARSEALTQRIGSAPARIEQLRDAREQESTAAPPPLPVVAGGNEAIRQRLNDELIALQAEREMLAEHQQALIELRVAGRSLGETIAELEQALRLDRDELQATPPEREPAVLSEARRAYLGVRLELNQSRLEIERQRLANYELLLQLQTLERDVAERHVDGLQRTVEALEAELQRRRAASARAARVEAEAVLAETANLLPAVATIADDTAQVRRQLEDLIEQDTRARRHLRTVEQQVDELESAFDMMRRRLEVGGGDAAIVRVMRRHLQSLPSLDDYRRSLHLRANEINRVSERRVGIEERRVALRDIDAQVDALLDEAGDVLPSSRRAVVRDRAVQLLQAQRDALAELDRAYGRYLTRLTSIDAAERQLIALVRASTGFVEEKLLWIRTLSPLAPGDLRALPQALGWLFSPAHWSQALQTGHDAARARPLVLSAGGLGLVAVFGLRRRARRRLRELAGLTRRVRDDRFGHTLKALAYSVLLASGWPLLLALTGWLIRVDPPEEVSAASFTSAAGNALLIAAAVLWGCNLARVRSIPDGLDRAHFRWSDTLVEKLDRHWRVLGLPLAAAVFVVMAAMDSNEVDYIRALARPVFILSSLGLAAFFWRFYRILAIHRSRRTQQDPVESLPARWVPVLIALPVALALVSALGYHYLALQLAKLFGASVALLLGLIVLKDLLLRWVYVTERRLRLETALRQRAEQRAQQGQDQNLAEVNDLFEVEEPKLDYRELGEQSRNLVRVGLIVGFIFGIGWLWIELVPVVGYLDSVVLPFTRRVLIEGAVQVQPLTLADVAVALLILVVMVYALQNMAGLLEFTVLRRFGFDAGVRYALVTLSKYFVGAIGVISALSILGLDWSRLQWLVAALGVGLGFGLQEIVANFVCGIILLLERPVRVGDIVTVGDTDGTVARINIRATTIVTWEHKELVVPNKEFITGKVLNWTLSNSETRLLIAVGIAYGSNVRTARELILEAAAKVENVLDDPKPSVTFAGFGDNSLDLELRCFIASLDYQLVTRTALHEAIYDKLNDAGIEISFPQRDVHLDTTRPLEVKLHKDDGA